MQQQRQEQIAAIQHQRQQQFAGGYGQPMYGAPAGNPYGAGMGGGMMGSGGGMMGGGGRRGGGMGTVHFKINSM